MEIVDFLRARLDEDEKVARALVDDTRPGRAERWEFCDDGAIRDTGAHRSLRVKFTWSPEAAHIARHDPARVLADVEAKRALVAFVELPEGSYFEHQLLAPLARVWRDHPDFDPAWLED